MLLTPGLTAPAPAHDPEDQQTTIPEAHVQRRRTTARVAACAVAALLALSPAAAAGADAYPPRGVAVVAGVVDNDVVRPGQAVHLRGGGFAPGALVRLSVDGAQTGTTTADAGGAVLARFVIPEPGDRVIAASGVESDGQVRVVSVPVLVVRSVALQESDDTGAAATAPGLLLGFSAVLSGAAVLFAARGFRARRRTVAL